MPSRKETRIVEIRVAGNEAAFFWHLTLMTFDEDAKITSMRAFWSPSDFRVV